MGFNKDCEEFEVPLDALIGGQAGCPLSYIQQLLGHESISTTSGFYAFATLKTLADSIEKAYPSNNKEKTWKDKSVMKQLYKL